MNSKKTQTSTTMMIFGWCILSIIVVADLAILSHIESNYHPEAIHEPTTIQQKVQLRQNQLNLIEQHYGS
jgi:hypothetical protein